MIIKAKTQQEAIKLHLLKYGQITSFEAIQNYGATRLAMHIHVFRNQGMNIETFKVSKPNRYGTISTFANYKLVKK